MKAVLYEGPHGMRVVELPVPAPAEGEVQLRVGACGICGSDVHGYTGESGRRTPGQVMGHEFAGTIAALGSGVRGWQIGQRVAAFNIVGCARCRHCKTGNSQCCPDRKVIGVNTGTSGAFAEYVCVPAANLAAIADHVPFSTALLNEPLAVAYHALGHVPAEAETLAIVGGGTIGQCLVKVARVSSNRRIFLLEPIAEKRRLAEQNGAVALAPELGLVREQLSEGADAAIEAVGAEKTVQLALQTIRPGGTLVLLGNLAREVALPLQHISSTEKRLLGTYGFNFADFQTIVGWINEGRFALEEMLTDRCRLEETPALFADLAAGRRQALKIVVEP